MVCLEQICVSAAESELSNALCTQSAVSALAEPLMLLESPSLQGTLSSKQ